MDEWFMRLQSIGKALMLPIAVLPAAALLLRLGAKDVLDILFITQAGGAVFANLPLIFAIGIGTGLAKDNNGAAGLAGAVGWLVFTAALKAIDASLDMSVLAGILMGVTAGVVYNRFGNIQLPEVMGFFAGHRFVSIATAFAAILFAFVFGHVWGPCQIFIRHVGEWIIGAGAIGVFLYGAMTRLLIPLGLHHILNSFIWFVFGEYPLPNGAMATGDLNRFFAGDPTAGSFMAGLYLVMMFGLPGVAFAIYRAARAEHRRRVGGVLLSVAATSFLTGITEPIEFMFMFLSPVLFAIHAVLTGLAMAVAEHFGILHGFGFSAGFVDYVLNWGLATRPAWIIPLGIGFFFLYYFIFYWTICKLRLPTLGREEEAPADSGALTGTPETQAAEFAVCFGGVDNLVEIGSCITRLRLEILEPGRVDVKALKALPGVSGVVTVGSAMQVVVGSRAEVLADALRKLQTKE